MEGKGKYQWRGGWKKDVLGLGPLELLSSMRIRYIHAYVVVEIFSLI